MTSVSKKFSAFIILFLLSVGYTGAQEVVVPLKDNHVLREAAAIRKDQPQPLMKKGAGDTITLPFFDDFWYAGRRFDTTFQGIHPFDKLWMPTNTYINTSMAISPPSVGFATFDGLNKDGLAYHQGSGNVRGRADTLTSKMIDLSGFTNDQSLFLSFSYQPQGLGDPLEEEDSLTVEFKINDSNWVYQWSARGTQFHPFRQAIIQLKDTFLHNGFQFRFVGHASHTGNLDHWHVDYVYLDRGRNPADTVHRDVALVYPPGSILKKYFAMPARQVRSSNLKDFLRTDVSAVAKNNYDQGQNVQFGYQITKPDGSIFAPSSNPGIVVNNNVDAFSNFEFKLGLANDINTFGITDQQFDLRVKYQLVPGAQVTAHPENDTAETLQKFRNFYAYDDGTAEAGYGLDENAKLGSVAIKFETSVEDTLSGIAVHFNQAEKDNRFMPFSLIIWKSLSPVGEQATSDNIIARIDDLIPQHGYGYRYFKLENPVKVTGTFYVGWFQNREFIMNVGLDQNYPSINEEPLNTNLFFNTLGYWERSAIKGAPMIRPVFGSQPYVSAEEVKAPVKSNFSCRVYPNPSRGNILVKTGNESPVSINLYDFTGKLVDQQQKAGKDIQMDYSTLPKGIYLIRIEAVNGSGFSSHKLILE